LLRENLATKGETRWVHIKLEAAFGKQQKLRMIMVMISAVIMTIVTVEMNLW